MGLRYRLYYCNHCKQSVKRLSNKKWIKSICDKSDYKTVRLVLKSAYKKYDTKRKGK